MTNAQIRDSEPAFARSSLSEGMYGTGNASDPLSDILRLTEATSVMAGGIAAGGAWSLAFPPPEQIKFSIVAKGTCLMRLDGQKRVIRGEQGDVVLMSGRRGFVIGSCLEQPPRDALAFMAHKRELIGKIGDGSESLILAGAVALNPATSDLLQNALPPIIHIKAGASEALTVRWIVNQLLAEQTGHAPGTNVATSGLAQLLFVQILRAHMATAPRLPTGWLRALRDERLAPALRLIHADPARDWSLAVLAHASAMSRTTFAVRFKEAAGVAPGRYLIEWRIRLAQRRLRNEKTQIYQIAAALGYSSESAFSQTFKRVTGMPPSEYRALERSRQ
jgi:AraC-like DNA-binding protein